LNLNLNSNKDHPVRWPIIKESDLRRRRINWFELFGITYLWRATDLILKPFSPTKQLSFSMFIMTQQKELCAN